MGLVVVRVVVVRVVAVRMAAARTAAVVWVEATREASAVEILAAMTADTKVRRVAAYGEGEKEGVGVRAVRKAMVGRVVTVVTVDVEVYLAVAV